MPRPSPRLSLLALALAAYAGLAGARQSTQPQSTQPQATRPQATSSQPTPSQAPPKLQTVEPGSDIPATNIPPKRGTQIVEKRDDSGQVTEVEVTAGGSHYTMKPNNLPGNAAHGSVTGNAIRAPQWKVGEFDLSGKRRAVSDTGQNAPTAEAPPPPPLPANAAASKQ